MTDRTTTERIGQEWARRDFVTDLWAAGMKNPLVRSGFWKLAYGVDSNLFTYEWESVAEIAQGSTVLDVPSGAGVALLGVTSNTQFDYTAVDIAPAMVQKVREIAGERGLERVNAVVGDATDLPFPDQSFDVVLSYNGLHCMNEPWTALKEFSRVLKHDGTLKGTILLDRPNLVATRVQHYFQWRRLLGPIGTWAEVHGWFQDAGLDVTRSHQSGALAFFTARPRS